MTTATRTPDPIFDPFIAKLQTELVRYVIGQKLGVCPVTGQSELDVDTAIQVWDAEPVGNSKADLKLIVSPVGRHAIKDEVVAELGWVIVDPAARRRETAAERRAAAKHRAGLEPVAAKHRAGLEPVQVAGAGWHYWGTCSCGWRSQARFPDQGVAEQAAANHVAAAK